MSHTSPLFELSEPQPVATFSPPADSSVIATGYNHLTDMSEWLEVSAHAVGSSSAVMEQLDRPKDYAQDLGFPVMATLSPPNGMSTVTTPLSDLPSAGLNEVSARLATATGPSSIVASADLEEITAIPATEELGFPRLATFSPPTAHVTSPCSEPVLNVFSSAAFAAEADTDTSIPTTNHISASVTPTHPRTNTLSLEIPPRYPDSGFDKPSSAAISKSDMPVSLLTEALHARNGDAEPVSNGFSPTAFAAEADTDTSIPATNYISASVTPTYPRTNTLGLEILPRHHDSGFDEPSSAAISKSDMPVSLLAEALHARNGNAEPVSNGFSPTAFAAEAHTETSISTTSHTSAIPAQPTTNTLSVEIPLRHRDSSFDEPSKSDMPVSLLTEALHARNAVPEGESTEQKADATRTNTLNPEVPHRHHESSFDEPSPPAIGKSDMAVSLLTEALHARNAIPEGESTDKKTDATKSNTLGLETPSRHHDSSFDEPSSAAIGKSDMSVSLLAEALHARNTIPESESTDKKADATTDLLDGVSASLESTNMTKST
jgi:hypothetical protein